MPAWVSEAYDQYLKRLPNTYHIELIEINPVKRTKTANKNNILKQESERILAAIPANSTVIALDEKGKAVSSKHFSQKLDYWQLDAINPVFLIGGADGLSPECLQRSDDIWSLSALTFPHAMVRVIMIEQIYRAWSILQGHPYHRE